MALVCSVLLQAKVLYLNTGGSTLWEKDGANKFVVWHWQGSNAGAWSSWMTKVEGNIWKTEISDGSDHVIFCRCNPSLSSPDWGEGKVWNQTGDLSIPSGSDMYVISGWEKTDGDWTKYGESGGGGNPGGGNEPIVPTDYASAVPDKCTDIMLQAFYWDSDADKGFGDTKWQSLTAQAEEIGKYFSLVWLPPSAAPSPGGIYIPSCYSTQSSSKFGKKSALEALLAALHKNGVRVVADIVINHCGNANNACDYNELDFGSYGKFYPQSNWMTSNDEGVSKYGCSGGSNADDGQNGNDANYGDARDWDHKNPDVQKMCRAYLQWMKNEMKYDGFRFDFAGGFHTSHLNDYNSASKPYFSVMEYWNGDAGHLKSRVDDAGKNTLAFDFPNRYSAFKGGIAKGKYEGCKNSGLRGQGYSKYAVTFIDNHDTFQRTNTESDITESTNGSSINNQSVILQCNAYMLALPGVPCVFWPHWIRYKSEIQQMITARRMAGIHSESSMQEEAGGDYYRATVQGKYGSVKVMLGSAANDAAPSGYKQAVKGNGYAMYYTGDGAKEDPDQEGINDVQSDKVQCTKVLRDGQLYIMYNGKMYNVQGKIVEN